MKAPKNFYNAVDQKKLGLDDLFDRTAELENDVSDLEKLKPLVDFNESGEVAAININRQAESTKGEYSATLGKNNVADGSCTLAGGIDCVADGSNTVTYGRGNHSNGSQCAVFGRDNTVSNPDIPGAVACNLVAGRNNRVTEYAGFSLVVGYNNKAEGSAVTVVGQNNEANHRSQLVFGESAEIDPSTASYQNRGTYIEIVGNGVDPDHRSNARTLDWNGNEVLAGDLTISVNGTATSLATFIQAVNAYMQAHP